MKLNETVKPARFKEKKINTSLVLFIYPTDRLFSLCPVMALFHHSTYCTRLYSAQFS